MRKLVKVGFSIVILMTGVALGVGGMVFWMNTRLNTASEAFYFKATLLADPSREWSRNIYSDFDVPGALVTRESAVVHYLLLSIATSDKFESDATFQLGIELIPVDCRLARKYLREHLQMGSPRREAKPILEEVEKSGCKKVEQLFEDGYSWSGGEG